VKTHGEWRHGFIIIYFGTRQKRVSFTHQPLYPRVTEPTDPLDRKLRGLEAMDNENISCCCQESNPGLPDCNPSLYELSYPVLKYCSLKIEHF
jgi:hypothetical protein